mmetsp:Transcript_14131/g.38925  ORF Transcript_14131/g.38925 Transcript_14131/m.38925 type:complete len:270 (-) Transcript_14131:1262-2071(-)
MRSHNSPSIKSTLRIRCQYTESFCAVLHCIELNSARADFIAGIRALEGFLDVGIGDSTINPDLGDAATRSKGKCCPAWFSMMNKAFWRGVVFISMYITGFWSIVFLVRTVMDFSEDGGKLVVTLMALGICISVSIGLGLLLLFSFSHCITGNMPESDFCTMVTEGIEYIGNTMVTIIATVLFGINRREIFGDFAHTDVAMEDHEDEVLARIETLQKRLDRSLPDVYNQSASAEQNQWLEQRLAAFEHTILEHMRQQHGNEHEHAHAHHE